MELKQSQSHLQHSQAECKLLQSQSQLPFVDLSIVTHNSEKWVEQFFKSLIAQNYPTTKLNIFLTDNQSTDNTLNISRLLAEKNLDKFCNFQIFEQFNRGFGCGHNYNLSKSYAPYFLVSNIDLEFAEDAILKAVITAILDDEDVASWEFRQKPFEHPKHYNPVTLETRWSSHACILFRRSALEKVKGYEEKIFLYGEDVELSYRLRDNGFRLKYCPKAVCWHYTYEHPEQVKPLQFFGSTLANSYLRLRYGSLREIATIPLMYARLWFSRKVLPNQRIGLLKNIGKLLRNAPYFLITRKRSNSYFPFRGWDYDLIRDGAFYRYHQETRKKTPLVSVIIRTYKGRLNYLMEAVTSVLNQTYPNIELVVIEDGSDTAEQYLQEIAKTSGIKVKYRAEEKHGRCRAGNVGLAESRGDLILFLDDDDLFFAEHVEVLTDELLLYPGVAATYSCAWEVKTELISLEPLFYKEMSFCTVYTQRFSRALMWHHNYIPIQSILFRRELYDRHGGFDESLEYLEDWNLWTRYCLHDEFMLVEKNTSLYRVPYEAELNRIRQQTIDSYYPVAVGKQKELSLSVTPVQIIDFHRELANYENVGIISKPALQNILSKNFLMRSIYRLIMRVFGEVLRKLKDRLIS